MITIALIDKRPVARIAFIEIIKYVNNQEVLILEAKGVEDFFDTFSEIQPDVFIIAVSPIYGIVDPKVILSIKKLYPLSKIVVYDEFSNYSMTKKYVNAGASGYLSKQADAFVVQECLNLVLQGKHYLENHVILAIIKKSPPPEESLTYIASRLSSREQEVVILLCQGMRISEIAAKLGKKYSTISTFKRSIFEKFGVNHILQLKKAVDAIVTKQGS